MNKKIITTILIILALASIPIYWLRLAFTIIPIRDGLYMTTVLASVAGSYYAMFKYGFKNPRRTTLICIALAFTCLFIQECIFEYHYIINKNDIPYPSVGDIFQLSYYPLFFAALINEIRLAKVKWSKVNKPLVGITILISLVLIGVVSYYGVYLAYDPTVNLITNVVNIAYGIGDLFLIIMCLILVIIVRDYRMGQFAKIWSFLLIGVAFYLTSDILYDFYITPYNNDVWFYKSLLDTLLMLAYLSFAQSLFLYGYSISDALAFTKNMKSKPDKDIKLTFNSPTGDVPKSSNQ